MHKVQNGTPAGNAWSTSTESAPNDASNSAAAVEGESCEDLGIDNEADASGHTLLSRPQGPQGRRSLFRR